MLEETIENWNEAENGDQEEIYLNNNILARQREKKQRHRPEFPITENYIKTGGGYIKNKKKEFYRVIKHMPKLQGIFRKSK